MRGEVILHDTEPGFGVDRGEDGHVTLTIHAEGTTIRVHLGGGYDTASLLAQSLHHRAEDLDAGILTGWAEFPDDGDASLTAERGRYTVSLDGIRVGPPPRVTVRRPAPCGRPHPTDTPPPGGALPSARSERASARGTTTMHETVRIEPGYHIIDSQAWVCQRTSPPVADLTAALNEFIDHQVLDDLHIHLGASARMQLWCAARGWSVGEDTTHHHTHDVLSEPVTIVLATGPERCAYALVQIGHDDPDVYLDLTPDDGYWLQVEPVDIVCPGGHRWTWLDHLTLLDDTGNHLRFTDVFGRAPGAPYAECRDCLADDDGDREEMCGCDNRHTVYCPTCDQRCRLELACVPTYTPGEP